MIFYSRRKALLIGGGLCTCTAVPVLAQFLPQSALPPEEPMDAVPELDADTDEAVAGLDRFEFDGCRIQGAEGSLVPGDFYPTSGDAALDQKFGGEYLSLQAIFGFTPSLLAYDDIQGANAFAVPRCVMGTAPHGTVAFGLRFISEEIYSFGESALSGIFAHEWAHIMQFHTMPDMPRGKIPELHADFLAGWYTSLKQMMSPVFDLQAALTSIFEKGDLAFNDPQHHGTPDERLAIAMAGAELMRYQMGTREAPDPREAFLYGRELVGWT